MAERLWVLVLAWSYSNAQERVPTTDIVRDRTLLQFV